ncbi:hypothetical protein ALC53_09020, partial [Atta colombica]
RGPILGARDEVAPTSPPTHRRNTDKIRLRETHASQLHVLQRKRQNAMNDQTMKQKQCSKTTCTKISIKSQT